MIILLTDGSPVLTMHHFSAVDDMPSPHVPPYPLKDTK